jgi:hypothetical protein
MMSGLAVTLADPSGLWGTLKESFASGGALLSAKQDQAANPLVKAVAEDFGTAEGRTMARGGLKAKFTGQSAAAMKETAVESLTSVSALLDQKAPQDAAAFKTWLIGVSKSVAAASAEGGFLGFGGVDVSDAEKATLAEIASALKVQVPAA